MRLIGLTGGIATGKSTFAAALRRAGVPVIDADALARAAVEPGTAALEEVIAAFGPEMRSPQGGLDRKRLGARVFADPEARARLEAILHPAVRKAMLAERDRLAGEGRTLAFYDVPLLFETGLDRQVDCAVLVYAPRETALARLMARDGLSRSEAEARLAAQLPIEEKRARADVVVVNEGGPDALEEKARLLLADLSAGLGRGPPGAPPRLY